jgi:FXSXX-COOH protein
MSAEGLAIDRWSIDSVVRASPERQARAAERLRRVVETRVPGVLERVLGPHLSSGAVVFVRRLDLELVVDLGRIDDDTIAAALGERLARALARVLAGGPGDDVAIFESRAAFVACYVRDVADGRADDHWYYDDFDGLRPLTKAARIAEAIVREPMLALDVLVELAATRDLRSVLDVLTRERAAQIWRALPLEAMALERAVARWLEPLAELLAVRPRYEDPADLRNAIELVARLGSLAGTREAIEAVLAARARAAANDGGVPSDRSFFDRAFDRAVDAVHRAIAERPHVAGARARAPTSGDVAPESARTELGGAFLLLPALVDLHGVLRDSDVRHRVLVRALGRSSEREAKLDPVLRWVAGARTEASEPPREVHARWLRHAIDRGHAGGRLVRITSALAPDGARWHVARDVHDDAWILVARDEQDLERRLRESFPAAHVAWTADLTDAALTRHLEQARDAAPDFEYLGLGSTGDDDEISLLAHALVRSFTRTLLGFGWSRLEHVRKNLLGTAADLRYEADVVRVRIERPPLHTVLRIAGYAGRRIDTPWLDRPILLELAGGA